MVVVVKYVDNGLEGKGFVGGEFGEGFAVEMDLVLGELMDGTGIGPSVLSKSSTYPLDP